MGGSNAPLNFMADTGVEDFEKFAAALKKVEEATAAIAKTAVGQALAAIEEYSAEYAPASDANQPGRSKISKTGRVIYLPYYQRGRGTMRPVVRMRALQGYKLDPTSERMEVRFRIRVAVKRGGEVNGVLDNTASYSGWVIGPLSPEADPHQTALHHTRGWTAADDAVEQAWPDIERIFNAMADEIIKQLTAA